MTHEGENMEYLIAVDLEGIGGVVGTAYQTLNGSPDFEIAKENAIREINAAAKALFEMGATKVAVWDNHGGGGNLDFSKMDSRVVKVEKGANEYRLDFSKNHNFKGIIFLGYHAREGSFGGVLAHTFSSVSIQYAKIDGHPVGELEIDSYIAATHGIAPLFLASDDVCVNQFKETSPATVTVVTKYGKGRNSAELRDEDEVVREIYEGVKASVTANIPLVEIKCPIPYEVRYTRAEKAAEMYERGISDDGIDSVKYGDDTHTLHYVINSQNRLSFVL